MANFCYDDEYLNNGNNAGAYLENCNTYANYSMGVYQQTNSLSYLCQKCKFLWEKVFRKPFNYDTYQN